MFFVRADGNAILGLGHVMRCLSIADALKEMGEVVQFLVADDHVASIIMEKGYDVLILGTDYQKMETEIPIIENLFKELDVSKPVCLVDSYQVTESYLEKLSQLSTVVMMDDIFLMDYPVPYVVNYNIYGDLLREQPTKYPKRKLFTGVKYAPLREQFIKMRQDSRKIINKLEQGDSIKRQDSKEMVNIQDKINHIMISTGGSDSLHLAEKIIKEFLHNIEEGFFKDYPIQLDVVCGALNPNKEALKLLQEKNPEYVNLHIDVKDMAGLLSKCDLAVTAAGSTVYELSTLGVPFVLYYFADNQKLIAKYAKDILGVLNAGDFSNESEELILDRIMNEIKHLMSDDNYKNELSKKLSQIVDGEGAKRIANELRKISNGIE